MKNHIGGETSDSHKRAPLALSALFTFLPLLVSAEDKAPDPMELISLESDVTFHSPAGDPVLVPAGHYTLSGSDARIELTDLEDEQFLVSANEVELEEAPETTEQRLLIGESDNVHLLLWQTNGRGLEAIGSQTGIFSRGKSQYSFLSRMLRRPAPSRAGSVVNIPDPVDRVPNATTNNGGRTNDGGRSRSPNPLSDLALTSCRLENRGRNSYFVGVIKNQGYAPASFKTRQIVASSSGAKTYKVPAPGGGLYLPRGGTHEVLVSAHNLPPGRHTVNWKIDPDNVVQEAAEFNNVRSCSGVVPEIPQTSSDLIISRIRINPTSGTPTTSFSANITVRNIGTGPSQAGAAHAPYCFLDGAAMSWRLDRWRTAPIPPSGSKTFNYRDLRRLIPGTHKLDCKVDRFNRGAELREDNNSMIKSIIVR